MKNESDSFLVLCKKLTVLFISNNSNTILENKINNYFNNIVTVNCLDTAIQNFDTYNIDLVIVDLEVTDGFKILELLKSNELNLISIVFSSKPLNGDLLRSIELGVDGFFSDVEDNEYFENILKKVKKKYDINYRNEQLKQELNFLRQYQDIELKDKITPIVCSKKHLLSNIELSDLSLLILIQIEEFEMLEKFYNADIIDKIEQVFSYKLLSYLGDDYDFENIYSVGSGRFALLTDFNSFSSANIDLKVYLEKFVQNVKENVISIDEVDYDINIVLSYSFGKYMLYEDAKSGLENAMLNKVVICYSNDFSIQDQKEARKSLDIIKMVKIALDNYNIISYLQPIINNKTKEIEKYESLVRLIDEDGKILSPMAFLEVSKKSNYHKEMTLRILENSFKMLHQIAIKISINVSILDIENDEIREYIYELLAQYSNDTNRLVFELLEDESVRDFTNIKAFIKKVKSLGVQIAIDDFGVGYSNFERLLEFEPDILKIDGSLVKDIITNSYSRNIVESIVTFAKKESISTIAEYVESEEIFNYLNELGVNYSQGYYFGKPEDLQLF